MRNLTVILCSLFVLNVSHAQQQGIINNAKSPHVKLKSINMGDCQWTSGFWADKFKVCEEVMVPHMGTLLKGDVGHAYNNFKIVAGLKEGKHQGTNWHDGDFYKWMESAMYVYAINKDPKILTELDEIIEIIGKAQAEDGYLHTAVMLKGLERFSNRQYHEMYNSGHLLTSACIHHRVTGKTNFLNIARKHADYLYEQFKPRPGKLKRFGFNQTQIMGLVELYRTTKNKEYLHLAEIFINMRGKSRDPCDPTVRPTMVGDMVQERKPLRKETEAVGHAVLALYFYAGAADVVAETGDQALANALERIWDSVNRKMYVTGACGQAHHGSSPRVDFVHEAFIADYMMPNLTAYNETCANICNAMFNYRMLGLKGESKYADIMELVLYNSALSGISADGTHYFYTNPLRRTRGHAMDTTDQKTREPYIPCFCCPPNLVRTVAKVSGWAYSLSKNGVAVNLYGGNKLSTKLLDGSELRLKQETDYPWDGKVKITIESCKDEPFELGLRIPEWADRFQARVNGTVVGSTHAPGNYLWIIGLRKAGDVIELDMPMKPRLLVGHPRIEEIRNQAAIKRGPVVYCIETPDLPENTDILDVYLPSNIQLKAKQQPDFLGGMTTLSGDILLQADQKKRMYRTLKKPDWKKVNTRFVPYYAWSNRGEAEMTVWMPIVWDAVREAVQAKKVYPTSDPSNTGGWVMKEELSDEFDGEKLNTAKWYVEGTDGKYQRWMGRAPSQFSAANVRVEDGKLKLTTKWDPDFDYSTKIVPEYKSPYEKYTTAAVQSRNKVLYAYMEIKCKAADASITSSFWTTGKGSELDIFEFVGDSKRADHDKRYQFATHDWSTKDGNANVWKKSVQLDWRVADDFHVYGCEWYKDGLKFYADGKLVKTATRAELGKAWVLTQPLMIWVDSETFYWEGYPDKEDLPVDYEIDYIRVWQKK